MIKTGSIYTPKEDGDGLRVLITRFHPRGVSRKKYDVWTRALAPSTGLLNSYKNSELDWDEFEAMLVAEFAGNADSVKAIRFLRGVCSAQNITLLCYERDGLPCHRYIVRDLISGVVLPDKTALRGPWNAADGNGTAD